MQPGNTCAEEQRSTSKERRPEPHGDKDALDASAMKQTSKVRLAIIGCGKIAEQSHIPAALAASNTELVAVVDSLPERLGYVVGSFRLSCLATTSSGDLPGHVDAVLVSLPNHLHYPVASEFLRAGVHVLCEKPLANTAQEGRLLCEVAESRGLILAVGYVKRFERNFDLMKRLIEDRFLGTLHRFEFDYGTTGGWAPVSAYNLQRDHAGGGVLMINGCHFLDRMLCWFGYPSAIAFSDDSHGGVEANCSATFTFESGLVGEVTLSRTHSLRNRLRLYGERGCIEIKDSHRDSVTFFPAGHKGYKHEISMPEPHEPISDVQYFQFQIEDFVRAVQSGVEPRVTGRSGLASLELIEQCYRVRTPLPESWVFDSLRDLNVGCCGTAKPVSGGHVQREPVSVFSAAAAGPSGSCSAQAGARPKWSAKGFSGGASNNGGSVFITGATGFVGSRLCEVMHLTTDYQPRAFVHSSGSSSYIARYPLDFALGDLNDFSSVRRAIDGCTYAVHLARGSDQVMINGLKNTLRAAAEAKVRRFIHVSSVAVYGHNPPPAATRETAPTRKTGSSYGDIKLEQEKLVASYGRRFGLPFVILRPPHIYGPRSHFVDAVSQRLQAGVLPILDGGLNICNLVYVDNLVDAILLSIAKDAAVGETFFVTDKERVTWKECLDDFGTMLGVEVPHATADQLDLPVRPTTRDSLLKVSRALLSDDFRSGILGIPVLASVAIALNASYAQLPARHRNYIRSRLGTSSVPVSPQVTPSRFDATDYLIASQRRTVVHSCEKVEQMLGYPARVGYSSAMAITRAWLQSAKVI
jgi:predicted dehydrogenase/nucleoside-diphosphate-sugar epimerase